MKIYTLWTICFLLVASFTISISVFAQQIEMEAEFYGELPTGSAFQPNTFITYHPNQTNITIQGERQLLLQDQGKSTTYLIERMGNWSNTNRMQLFPWIGNFKTEIAGKLATISINPSNDYPDRFHVSITTEQKSHVYIARIVSEEH